MLIHKRVFRMYLCTYNFNWQAICPLRWTNSLFILEEHCNAIFHIYLNPVCCMRFEIATTTGGIQNGFDN